MTEVGRQTVNFSTIVSRAAEDAYVSLRELIEKSKSSEQSDTEKKTDFLNYISKTQQRMLRLNVLAKWCLQVPLVQECQQLASALSCHDTCFSQAADSLFFMHKGLQQARAPIYDVPSAVDVLLTGSYHRLPKCIDELGMQSTLNEEQQKLALKRLDMLVRSKLLEVSLPGAISEVKVKDGTALVCVVGEFKVLVTLGYRGNLSLWRILNLELLLGERTGLVKLEKLHRHALGDDLERRMAASDNPFVILYSVLHELCVALIMDTVIRQVRALQLRRWKDVIKFELISDGGVGQGGSISSIQVIQEREADSAGCCIPGVKITYWLDSGSCPFIKIKPGLDLQIECVHGSFVIDPATGKEAELYLDPSCIDVEKLLLKAICCKRYTHLLEIHKELMKSNHICRSSGDLCLDFLTDEAEIDHKEKDIKFVYQVSDEQEVLRIRAYGSSYFILAISIRNGRYLLRSSKHIVAPSVLSDYEDSLNRGSKTAVQVFISLRSKSILHLFASIGKFLNIQVYDSGLAAVKVPKAISDDSKYLLMGFPESVTGSSYFLLLQVDKDFNALLKLIKTQSDQLGNSDVVPVKMIDFGHMRVLDDINLSTLEARNLSTFLPASGAHNQPCENNHFSDFSVDSSMRIATSPPTSFSSVVDEVLDLDKGGPQFSVLGARVSTTSSMLNSSAAESSKIPGSDAMATSPISQARDFQSDQNSNLDANLKLNKHSRKQTVSDLLNLLPSVQDLDRHTGVSKGRKWPSSHSFISRDQAHTLKRCGRGDLITKSSRRNAHPTTTVIAFMNVVRHCFLWIKHAELTSQMEALEIPYVPELCTDNAFSNIWFRLPSDKGYSWPHICLRLGRLGSMHWDVKISDQCYRDLWDLQKGANTSWGNGVCIANTSDVDSHIYCDSEGVVLSYQSVESNSIEKLVADLGRLSSARMFFLKMRELLGVGMEGQSNDFGGNIHSIVGAKGPIDEFEKLSEQKWKAFKIEAVGLMSLWFSYGSGSGVLARFVAEWKPGKEGCTMRVSPDGLWPHIQFLEDFINEGEVASLLDCIRLTAGPLHALVAATRPARAGQVGLIPDVVLPIWLSKQNAHVPSQGLLPESSVTNVGQVALSSAGNQVASSTSVALGSHDLHSDATLATAGPGASGIPSSLLPFDVSVVARGPYWIRIIYRKHFAVDMRCFAGDDVWLQPAPPLKGGPEVGGSLPCPKFRPFIMNLVAQELNWLESNVGGRQPSVGPRTSNNANTCSNPQLAASGGSASRMPGVMNQLPNVAHAGNTLSVTSNLAAMSSVQLLQGSAGTGVPAHVRGEFNVSLCVGDVQGYSGEWVPLVALQKVLCGIFKYLGVLWLFAQLPDLLKETLGSILKENEGSFLKSVQEQPVLRFFIGRYIFDVIMDVHRVELVLQVMDIKRIQPQQNLAAAQEKLTRSEISEICNYFSRRVASEPYDVSRVASFITLLTLPKSVLREFVKLITWKKSMLEAQGGAAAPSRKPRIELSLENHSVWSDNSSATKSNIQYDRPHNLVEFALTVVLGPAHRRHSNFADAADCLPYCVSVRLRYSFGERPSVSFLGMEGSHGGRACWPGIDEWGTCEQRVAETIEAARLLSGDVTQGRLRLVAEGIQTVLHLCLQRWGDRS